MDLPVGLSLRLMVSKARVTSFIAALPGVSSGVHSVGKNPFASSLIARVKRPRSQRRSRVEVTDRQPTGFGF